jgi:hypothetical protein
MLIRRHHQTIGVSLIVVLFGSGSNALFVDGVGATTASYPAIFSPTDRIPIDQWRNLLKVGVSEVLDLLHVDCIEDQKEKSENDGRNENVQGTIHEELPGASSPSSSCMIHVLLHGQDDLTEAAASMQYLQNSRNNKKDLRHQNGADLFISFLATLQYNDDSTRRWIEPRMRQKEFYEQQYEHQDAVRGRRTQHSHHHHRRERSLAQVQNGNSYSHIFSRECYLDYDGMVNWIEDLVASPPSHLSVKWTDIGDSYIKSIGGTNGYAGKDINVLQIDLADGYLRNNETGTDIQKKAPLLLVSSTHPREWAPPELVRRWIERIVEEDPPSPSTLSFLQHTSLRWVPYLNPDGRLLAETTQPFRRKNLNAGQSGSSVCAEDSYGVDLNRNFPVAWYIDGGSSNLACSSENRGTGPSSEPESQALIAYAQSIFPQEQQSQSLFSVLPTLNDIADPLLDSWPGYDEAHTSGVFVDVHSFGQVYVFPFGFGDTVCPNDESFQASIGKLEGLTGYKAMGPSTSFYGAASGATDDWAYGMLGALSMTWEIGSAFHEECPDFESILEASFDAFTYLANIAPRPFWLSKGPDITKFDAIPVETSLARANATSTSLLDGMSLSLFIEASDNQRQAIAKARSAQQDVIEIRLFADTHPVVSLLGNNTQRPQMAWSSNDFSLTGTTAIINITLTWDEVFSGLFRGRDGDHILYVQALDSDGYFGPVAATNIHVDVASGVSNAQEEEDGWMTNFSGAPTARNSEVTDKASNSQEANTSIDPSELASASTSSKRAELMTLILTLAVSTGTLFRWV